MIKGNLHINNKQAAIFMAWLAFTGLMRYFIVPSQGIWAAVLDASAIGVLCLSSIFLIERYVK